MAQSPLSIAYFGLPIGAEILRRNGVKLSVICVSNHDGLGMNRVRKMAKQSLVLARPDLHDARVQALIASRPIDRMLSFFWPRKIPEALLALAPAFGTHPSLLPALRGADPYYHAILQGLEETGVTLHALEAEYDTGPIVTQTRVPIAPDETGWSLARKIDVPALKMLTYAALAPSLASRPQPEGGSLAPSPTLEELALDFSMEAAEVQRHVRASAPYPGTSALLGETLIEVSGAEIFQGDAPIGLRPGEAFQTPRGWAIQCAQGALLITHARIDEESLRGPTLARVITSLLRDPSPR